MVDNRQLVPYPASMSDRRMLHNAEQDVIQAACRIVEASENPRRYEAGAYLEDGSELLRAVHLLHKLEEAAGLRKPKADHAEDEDVAKAQEYYYVVRQGLKHGKGKYLARDFVFKKSVHGRCGSGDEVDVNAWTADRKEKAPFSNLGVADEYAALHGGRVVRVVLRDYGY